MMSIFWGQPDFSGGFSPFSPSNIPPTWQCVKTLYPCSSHQNSWDLWMFIPLKMVLIGIDPSPKNIRKTPRKNLSASEDFRTSLRRSQFWRMASPSSSFCSFGEILETRQISSYRSSRVKHMEKTCENVNKHVKMFNIIWKKV